MILIIFLALVILIIVLGVNEIKKKSRYNKGLMNDEERVKYEKQLAKQEQTKKSKTIKQVIIVNNSSDSKKKVGSTVIRGAIGNAMLGSAGLVGGALSGKNKVSNKKQESKEEKQANKLEQLQEELKKAIKEERYEDAAKIRDEIKNLNK